MYACTVIVGKSDDGRPFVEQSVFNALVNLFRGRNIAIDIATGY
jgi:hypothetical protein